MLKLVRFKSTLAEDWTSLADYKSRAGEGRKTIYYLTGENEARLRASPLLEVFKEKGIEVLLGTDEIDELAFGGIGEYEGMQFKSVQQVDAEEELGKDQSEHKDRGEKAVKILKRVLGDRVKDVRLSKRLGKSPSCVVVDKDEFTPQYRKLMERLTNEPAPEVKPILEINAEHPLIERLVALDTRKELSGGDLATVQEIEDLSHVLFYEAMLAEGEHFEVPQDFAERLNRLLAKSS